MYVLARLVKVNPVPAYIYYCTKSETRSSIHRSILDALTQGLTKQGLAFYGPIPVSDPTQSTPLVKSSSPICPEDYPELFI
jgi:hypothetical protein